MSELIQHFHFIRPWMLLSIAPAFIIFFLSLYVQKRSTEWQSLIAPHLLPHLLEGNNSPSSRAPLFSLLVLWILAIIALAGPTWNKIAQPVVQDNSALVVLFDLSPSMNTQDIKPSRLVRARLKLIDLLDLRQEGLTGLIAYAGEAHTVTPLTDDVETIKNLVPNLSPETMPVQGSNPEMAFEEAQRLLHDAGIVNGNIVFITDGIDPAANKKLRELHRQSAHKVSVWGFGTEEGAPIPLPRGGFARSKTGDIIVAKMDAQELSDAAVNLKGLFIPYTDNNSDIEEIRRPISSSNDNLKRETDRQFDQWVEYGPWLLLLLLPFAALSFRRGLVMQLFLGLALPVFFITSFSQPAVAQDKMQSAPIESPSMWQRMWQTNNQLGQKALDNNNPEMAADLFSDEQRKATALFRSNQFEEAAALFSDREKNAQSLYNKGTALTHSGQYDAAIESFNKALALKPEFEQAKNNKRIAEDLKLLEEQQQQEQEQEQQDSEQNQENKQQDQSQQEQSQQDQSQQDQSQQEQSQQGQSQQDQSEQGQQSQDQQNTEQAESDSQQAKEDFENQMREAEEQNQQEQEEKQAQSQSMAKVSKDESLENEEQSEEQQKLEQWLRKVPDDPGRLLRNKFLYEARERQRELDSSQWSTSEDDPSQRW